MKDILIQRRETENDTDMNTIKGEDERLELLENNNVLGDVYLNNETEKKFNQDGIKKEIKRLEEEKNHLNDISQSSEEIEKNELQNNLNILKTNIRKYQNIRRIRKKRKENLLIKNLKSLFDILLLCFPNNEM